MQAMHLLSAASCGARNHTKHWLHRLKPIIVRSNMGQKEKSREFNFQWLLQASTHRLPSAETITLWI